MSLGAGELRNGGPPLGGPPPPPQPYSAPLTETLFQDSPVESRSFRSLCAKFQKKMCGRGANCPESHLSTDPWVDSRPILNLPVFSAQDPPLGGSTSTDPPLGGSKTAERIPDPPLGGSGEHENRVLSWDDDVSVHSIPYQGNTPQSTLPQIPPPPRN